MRPELFRPLPDQPVVSQKKDEYLPINIHHDPRVARGNTYAGNVKRRGDEGIPGGPPGQPALQKEPKARRQRRPCGGSSTSTLFKRVSFAPPASVPGKLDLQRYLVEAGEDVQLPLHHTDTQTDEFEERPQTPDFVPIKTGIDASTQIEESDNLFDLDLEMQPLLDVLVGKTLEQARIEVEREHELEGIRNATEVLTLEREREARRISELRQGAVEAEREREELCRRRREEAAVRRTCKEKVACMQLVRQVLPLALRGAVAELEEKSWVTPTVDQIKRDFMPWVIDEASSSAKRHVDVEAVLGRLLTSVETSADKARGRRLEEKRRELEALAEARRVAGERVIRLFIPAEVFGGEDGQRLGPIPVLARNTVKEAELIVEEWLQKNEGLGDGRGQGRSGLLKGYLRHSSRSGEGGRRLGDTSTLLELQEHSGIAEDEVLLTVEGTSF